MLLPLEILRTSGNQPPEPVGVLIFFLLISPVLFWGLSYAYKRRNDHFWESGIFPPNLSFKRDHLLEAYICLAARMIQSDIEDAGKKSLYMVKYFNQHFPNSELDFSESLSYSYRNPIQIKTVARWMNKRLNKSQKLQVIYFLAGISIIDGSINSREMKLLRTYHELLLLSPKEFESVLNMYHFFDRKKEKKSVRKEESKRAVACKVLGVSEHASFDEIKKAYRSLVKQHHPDRFHGESEEQVRLARQRFITIQKAYEYLEQLK